LIDATFGAEINSVDDVDATGWWAAHSESILVDEAGVLIQFETQTYETATNNWNAPIYVVYTADEAFAGGAGISDTPGYAEYAVVRSDLYGWTPTTNTNDVEGWEAAGNTWEADAPTDWSTWLTELKAGGFGIIMAYLEDDVLTIYYGVGADTEAATSVAQIVVDSSKPVYLSLTGELCTLTNIAYTSLGLEEGEDDDIVDDDIVVDDDIIHDDILGDEDLEDEDATGVATDTDAPATSTGDVATAAMIVAMVGAAAAVVVLKKRVTE